MRIIRYSDAPASTNSPRSSPTARPSKSTATSTASSRSATGEADVKKLLAPIQPTAFFCIGLNYKRHAEEGKNPIPQFPGAVHEEPGGGAKSGRSDRSADEAQKHAGRLRVRAGRRDRQGVQERHQGKRPRLCARLYLRQRRFGPRLAKGFWRRPVVPRQDVRHVRPARPGAGD